MNFKEWLLTEENSIPEDDGTMGWWEKIPPEKLLDVFQEKDSEFKKDEILQQIQRKDQSIFYDILKEGGHLHNRINYYRFTEKPRSEIDMSSISNQMRDWANQKYSDLVKVEQAQREFVYIYPRKALIEKFSNHDSYAKNKNNKYEQKDKYFTTKMYLNPDVKNKNFLEITKKIIDYYVENFNFFNSMKLSTVRDRREVFVLYLSELGEKNKSKIESDFNTIIKKYDPNYKESIKTGLDGEGDGSYNQALIRIISVYAAAIHMDKDLIQKNLNYILSDLPKWGLSFSEGGNEWIIRNFKNYQPIMNLMQKKGININSFVDKFFDKYVKTKDQPETSPKEPQTSPEQPQTQSDKTGAIHLGKVHVQLAGNNLKVQGSKAMFNVRLEPNQLQQIANLTKLEAVMGTDPVTPVDLSKGGIPAGISIKNLGNADVHISKTALHLNNIQIPLKLKQVQYILNMLGMDETAFEQGDMKNSVVHLTAENGKTVKIQTSFFVGKDHFSYIPDFNRFFSDKQFNLTKDPSGSWTIQHNPSATNQTYLNGMPLSQPQKLSSGMKVTIGKSGKCPLTIEIK